MFFNSLNRKLKKSYGSVNPEIGRMVFPNGEAEYLYVGTILNTLFNKHDVFELLKVYASVYAYYKSELGNAAKTYLYAKKRAGNLLVDGEIKDLIALVMFNLTSSKAGISDPVAAVRQYRGFVDSYLQTVEGIKKNEWCFKPKTVDAGTVNSPLLVSGVSGVRDYINALAIPGVEKVTYKRTSTLHLTDENCGVSYPIDEYKLYNAKNSSEIATLWFNIYGTENTEVQPACFSGRMPFFAPQVAPELFAMAVKECAAIENICRSAAVDFDLNRLVLSSLAYFYQVWTIAFKNIRLGQSKELEKAYVDCFVSYNKETFANSSYSQVIENEKVFPELLERIFYRIRTAYEKNNFTFVDDGLSTEFICEFISNKTEAEKIREVIAEKLMIDWVKLGNEANQRYLT